MKKALHFGVPLAVLSWAAWIGADEQFVLLLQLVWTGGDKSMALWCAFSGAFLGTVDRGRELGEAASFRQDLARPSAQEEWRSKVDLSQGLELDSTARYRHTAVARYFHCATVATQSSSRYLSSGRQMPVMHMCRYMHDLANAIKCID